MAERGVQVDHATLNRWVVKYSPLIAEEAYRRKPRANKSWRMEWCYYRAVDKLGKTFDFMLSQTRDEAAATAFFWRAISKNGIPDRVVIDKSDANQAGLNNIIEQDYRFIKNLTKQMKGFKSFNSA